MLQPSLRPPLFFYFLNLLIGVEVWFLFCFVSFILCVFVFMFDYMHVYSRRAHVEVGGQLVGVVFSSTMWVAGIEFSSSCLDKHLYLLVCFLRQGPVV